MKFKVLQRIWSIQHQAYFKPGAVVDLDLTEQIPGVLQSLEVVETSSKKEQPEPIGQPKLPETKRVRK